MTGDANSKDERSESAAAGCYAAAQALCDKLDEVHEDPEYAAVWQIAQAHRGTYDGPTYEQELQRLKDALAAA